MADAGALCHVLSEDLHEEISTHVTGPAIAAAVWGQMETELREADGTERRVASVAFGRGFDAYFIVYADGSWCHAGAPKALETKITATGARCDLACVSLGPAGEWFVRTKSGGCWWGGQRPEHRVAVDRVKAGVRFLDFGAEGTYVCRYS